MICWDLNNFIAVYSRTFIYRLNWYSLYCSKYCLRKRRYIFKVCTKKIPLRRIFYWKWNKAEQSIWIPITLLACVRWLTTKFAATKKKRTSITINNIAQHRTKQKYIFFICFSALLKYWRKKSKHKSIFFFRCHDVYSKLHPVNEQKKN